MNNRATLFLFIGAIIAGVAAAWLTDKFITNKIAEHKESLDRQYTSVGVVVPTQNLRKGAVLDSSVLAVRKVPRAFIHHDTVMPGNVGDLISYQLVNPVNKGEPLLFSHVSKARGKGFSSLIEDGKRAITFPVDVVNSISGMLRPGDRIDLIMNIKDGDKKVTMPLMTNVTVMATGVKIDPEIDPNQARERYQNITLLVSSEDAARIIHANRTADLAVLLRSPEDASPTFDLAMTDAMLLNKTLTKTRRVAGPPRIEIIRNGEKK